MGKCLTYGLRPSMSTHSPLGREEPVYVPQRECPRSGRLCRMPRNRWRWLAAAAVMVLIIVAAAWLARQQGLEWLSWLAGVLAFAMLIVGGLVRWAQQSSRPAPEYPAGRLDAAAQALADAQREQWRVEEAARHLDDPWPLPVRWATTDRAQAVMVSWAAIRGSPNATAPIGLSGEFTQVADVFTAPQSPRRLVVLGEPGAGKTTLLLRLTLDLLDRRTSGTPADLVPVLVPLGSWQPDRQHLDDWIAEQLTRDYPALARQVTAPGGLQRSLAKALLAADRVLPVLDGLDEMPPARRVTALTAISEQLGRQRQFVLACRTVEYEQAVAASGPLARTPVVELAPLDPAALAAYLPAATATTAPAERWDPVLAHLHAHPSGPLAQALSTPLMAWLARRIYRGATADPSELLALAEDRDTDKARDAIERHLLDQFVPAAYGNLPKSRWTAQQAHGWLAALARQLDQHNTYDLAWWQLRRAVPDPVFRLTAGLAGALAGGLVFGITGGLAYGLVFGVVSGLVLGLSTGPSAPRAIAIGLSRESLAEGLRSGLVFGLAGWFAFGLAFGPVEGLMFGLASGLVLGLGSWLIVSASAPAELTFAVDPGAVARRDRTAAVALVLVFGLTVGLAFGFAEGLEAAFTDGLGAAFTDGFAEGLVAGLTGGLAFGVGRIEWWAFCMGRLWLAACGRTPLRLMTFLQDAHARGVLRHAGAVYQFRHALLQDQLAR